MGWRFFTLHFSRFSNLGLFYFEDILKGAPLAKIQREGKRREREEGRRKWREAALVSWFSGRRFWLPRTPLVLSASASSGLLEQLVLNDLDYAWSP